MKKWVLLSLAMLLAVALAACGNQGSGDNGAPPEPGVNQAPAGNAGDQQEAPSNAVPTAFDNAEIQTSRPDMATRVLESGTKINMYFGDTVIPGTLNDSETAQALIEMLPYTVRMNRYSHDFCGVMDDPLPYREENVHYGWLNGDIDFATNADYFTILFEDEEDSVQYGYQVNIGKIDCPLADLSGLEGSYDVRIELAE